MLRFLSIKRLAIIDAVEVEFDRGFNVLTGETGAGKSILVEAVTLLLGSRASADLVRSGEDTATIEAVFEADDSELIVRREITAQGRSRAFVNDGLVTAATLRDLSRRMVELHGQHEHQTLLDPATHLEVIDTYAGLTGTVAAVGQLFAAVGQADSELARLKQSADARATRLDLAAFELAELDRAALTAADEDTTLATTRQTLANAERLERLSAESYALLYESDDAVIGRLGAVWRRVAELASIDPQFSAHVEARDGIKSQLEDLADTLRRYSEGIDVSPERLQAIEQRLALLDRLKKKHGATIPLMIEKRERLRLEVEGQQGLDERMASLERDCEQTRAAYVKAAEVLGRRRRQAAATFTADLDRLLGDLAMSGARFDVRFQPPSGTETDWTARGMDAGEFFLSANPGEEPRPLARIASGGELSRIMLAIKTLMARSRLTSPEHRVPSGAAPGLVFDEVDSGIGGRVADIVGDHLRKLGSAFQVLCITHLPQIAAAADAHFQVEKTVVSGRTVTRVRRLTGSERVQEIGRMLGGAAVTPGILASAQEMIDARHVVRPPERRTAEPSLPSAGGESEPGAKGESERAKAKPRKGR
jgi:DNA repair protein RecN (Recombination protein N)